MEYQNLLTEWGLGAFIENFTEEGITDESFRIIDNDTIKNVFSKAGPRLIFGNKFKEFLNTINSPTNNALQDSHEHFSNSTSGSVVETYSLVPDEELSQLLHLSNCSHNSESGKRISEDNAENSPLKRLKENDCPSVFSTYDLESLLKKYSDGRLVLSSKNKLNNDFRQKIAKIVVNDLLISPTEDKKNYEITAEKFKRAAREIVDLFPGENLDTYYIPYTSGRSGLRQPSRGKLWSRYVNVRAALRIASNSITNKSSEELDDQQEHESTANEEADLLLLKTEVGPIVKIFQAWQATYRLRAQYKDITIDNLFDIFTK